MRLVSSIAGSSPVPPTKFAKTDRKEETMSTDAPGMRGYRPRNKSDGELRKKRSDTHIGTIEKMYGVDLNVRSDMKLGTFLKKNDITSLNDLITGK